MHYKILVWFDISIFLSPSWSPSEMTTTDARRCAIWVIVTRRNDDRSMSLHFLRHCQPPKWWRPIHVVALSPSFSTAEMMTTDPRRCALSVIFTRRNDDDRSTSLSFLRHFHPAKWWRPIHVVPLSPSGHMVTLYLIIAANKLAWNYCGSAQ
jgi:hypothetical protein